MSKLYYAFGKDVPSSSVDTIEYRHNQRRVVDFQASIETYDLKNSSNHEEDDLEYGRCVAKLIALVFVGQTPRDQFHTTKIDHQTKNGNEKHLRGLGKY